MKRAYLVVLWIIIFNGCRFSGKTQMLYICRPDSSIVDIWGENHKRRRNIIVPYHQLHASIYPKYENGSFTFLCDCKRLEGLLSYYKLLLSLRGPKYDMSPTIYSALYECIMRCRMDSQQVSYIVKPYQEVEVDSGIPLSKLTADDIVLLYVSEIPHHIDPECADVVMRIRGQTLWCSKCIASVYEEMLYLDSAYYSYPKQ